KGRPVRISIGPFPELNVASARKLARIHLNNMAEGINPNEEKRREREAEARKISFGDFFGEYVARHAKLHTKGGAEKAQRAYKLHLQIWAKKPLSSIAHRDIQELHTGIAEVVPRRRKNGTQARTYLGGKRAANLVVALLSHMFNKAKNWGYFS